MIGRSSEIIGSVRILSWLHIRSSYGVLADTDERHNKTVEEVALPNGRFAVDNRLLFGAAGVEIIDIAAIGGTEDMHLSGGPALVVSRIVRIDGAGLANRRRPNAIGIKRWRGDPLGDELINGAIQRHSYDTGRGEMSAGSR